MCLDRRAFLAGGAATAAWVATGARRPLDATPVWAPTPDPVDVAPGLTVLRRASWGADLPAPLDLPTEAPGDVRVLLVHHSASPNGYAEADVAEEIRLFHALHTGPGKGWPDVAYNFFVDRFGRVWEGRAGSLDGPVIGDATGGNQGFSQLVCLIGDFQLEPPSVEAVDALAAVLAWIARRDGVDVTPGATTSFTSRGSSRWPPGTVVETATIAGHRDMSQTLCPGAVLHARVRDDLPTMVAGRAHGTTTTPPPAPGEPSATAPPVSAPPAAVAERDDTWSSDVPLLAMAGGAAATAAGAALVLPRAVRRRRDAGSDTGGSDTGE
jgi:hypothetical protein